LRDTWATHALESGEMPIIEISKRIGHKDVYKTMQRYQHLTNRVLGENVQHVANYQFGNLSVKPIAWKLGTWNSP
jgi:integrase